MLRSQLPTLAAALALTLYFPNSLSAREFTSKDGRKMDATILEVNGESVKLKRGSKTFTSKITIFSESDQDYIRNWEKQQAEKKAAAKGKELATLSKEKFKKYGIHVTQGTNVYVYPKGEYDGGKYTVYVPESYDGSKKFPLIVSSHGRDGKGEKEIKGWTKLADEHDCIVVAPSYGNSTRSSYPLAAQEVEKLKFILERVKGTFEIDETKVMHTGFSGGGYMTWYSMQLKDEFTHLCFRCANYWGEVDKINKGLSKTWKDKPVYWFYGEKDARSVLREADNAKAFLNKIGCDLKWEKIPSWGHKDDKKRAIEWFMKAK